MLTELLTLRNEGAGPLGPLWFWYDSNGNKETGSEGHSFFVVYDNKIVREEVHFVDYLGTGFDPSLFEADSSPRGSWERARIQFWYRKFYSETRLGQLMVLRKPELSDRWNVDPPTRLLRKIQVQLWILIALVSVILIRFYK
jgi:hypothetical protein